MTSPNPRRRRPGRPGLFVMGGGLPPEDLRSESMPADLEPGNLPVWEVSAGPDATPADLSAAVVAALEWDRQTATEPYQVDVTREMDDTVRMGNSLSAAVRLELLAQSMREDFLDSVAKVQAVFDPVDGTELDPVDGLPVLDEDQADDDGPIGCHRPWLPPETWSTVADLEASARPMTFAAFPPPTLSTPPAEPDPVPMTPDQYASTGGAPARVMAWASRHDERSLAYGVRQQLRAPAPLVDRDWPHGPILDQGTAPPLSLHDASGCTGHAGVNAANVLQLAAYDWDGAERGQGAGLYDHEDAMRLYERAQELDDWPGETYPGTSILAAMKAGQEFGLWASYLWAFGTKDVAQAILQVGPVVIGIPWLAAMTTPGPDGILTVGGEEMGGHAMCLHAIRMRVGGRAGPFFGGLQTWGEAVGDHGVVWFHHRDLATLLRTRGEAAIPVATS